MKTVRQLRSYIQRLETAAYGLRSEAMLRSTPNADRKIQAFDEVIEEGRRGREELAEAEHRRGRRCDECGAMPGLIWNHLQFCSKAEVSNLAKVPE